MGRKSTKENKTIFQQLRESFALTREQASELLDTISADRLEKIENERIQPTPEDILQMAAVYKDPALCNHYCSKQCTIGKKYVQPVEITELPSIILETVASLNAIAPLTNRLIEISRDGKISDDEIPDFAHIQKNLEDVSVAIESLNFWIEKTISENKINYELLVQEQEKLKNNQTYRED